MDTTLRRWFDERFPPLSLFYGGRDFLILADPLLERIRECEPHVQLIRTEKIEASEVSAFFVHYHELHINFMGLALRLLLGGRRGGVVLLCIYGYVVAMVFRYDDSDDS